MNGAVGFALIGPFQDLPAYVKTASSQPNFALWHGIAATNADPRSFIGEYTGEIDVVTDANGKRRLAYTDCVPATVCDIVSALLGIDLDSTDREYLQAKMGTKPTNAEPDKGANLVQAKAGAALLWPQLSSVLSADWAQFVKLLDDGYGQCWLFEPMNKQQRPQRVSIVDLKPFMAANGYQFLQFGPVGMPSTATEDPMSWFANVKPIVPLRVTFTKPTNFFTQPVLSSAFKVPGWNPNGVPTTRWVIGQVEGAEYPAGSGNTTWDVVIGDSTPFCYPSATRGSVAVDDLVAARKAGAKTGAGAVAQAAANEAAKYA